MGNTRWLSFDIQARVLECILNCAALPSDSTRVLFSKPDLVNLISKDVNMVFYKFIYSLVHSLSIGGYDLIIYFPSHTF